MRDEAAGADRLGGREQVVSAARTQLAREREVVVEASKIERAPQGRHLVDHDLRLRPGDGLTDRGGVEAVHHDGLGAERADLVELCAAAGRGHDLVAARDELWHEPPPDRPACACNEDTHRCPPSRVLAS
jgi:hypothetical protein